MKTLFRNEKIKSSVKFLLKIGISATALYFVYKKVDPKLFSETILNTNIAWFLLALLAFNVSKSVAAFRLKLFYESQNVVLTALYNLKLYYVGMFYNLFLPGSVGGDAYKVYLLRNEKVKTKQLVKATILDRLSGLAILFVLGVTLLFFTSLSSHSFLNFKYLNILLAALALPVLYLFIRYLGGKSFVPTFLPTTHYSFWVQVGQVLTALALLKAINIEGNYFDYLYLFMISSVVAVIPFTVGGVGARELVFLYGYEFLAIEKASAITFTLLFFAVSAITSLIGFVISLGLKKQTKP